MSNDVEIAAKNFAYSTVHDILFVFPMIFLLVAVFLFPKMPQFFTSSGLSDFDNTFCTSLHFIDLIEFSRLSVIFFHHSLYNAFSAFDCKYILCSKG